MRIYNVDSISANYFAALVDLHNASLRRARFGDELIFEWTKALSRALLAADDLYKTSGIEALDQPGFAEFVVVHLGVCALLADRSIVQRERQRMGQ
jgi:hypothetical protein